MVSPAIDSNLTDANKTAQPGSFATVARDMPPSYCSHRERLRQCLIAAGAENLPDHELLELMLFASNPRAKVESLVTELLDRFGSLAEVLGADTEQLAAAGLGMPAIAGVKFVRELALRFMRAELRQRPVVTSWDTLIDFCTARMAYSTVEEFHILFLDRKNALIRDERQQRGTVDHTPVYTREVIKRALDLGGVHRERKSRSHTREHGLLAAVRIRAKMAKNLTEGRSTGGAAVGCGLSDRKFDCLLPTIGL